MIPLRDQEHLRQRFEQDLTRRVRIDFFTQKPSSLYIAGRQECAFCQEIQTLLEEIASLSDRVALTVHEYADAQELATSLGVDKVPAVVLRGQTNRPLRFFGLPSGTEFPGFIETIIDAARASVDLKPETIKQLRKLKTDVKLQVMVTTVCPHCPSLARTALKFGLQNNRLKVDIVEISEFPALAQRYAVRAVPTTVIEDKLVIPGAMDEATLLQSLMQAIEGKPVTGQTRIGAATALVPAQTAQQQSQARQSGSGLILLR